jgi:hypothetical protein
MHGIMITISKTLGTSRMSGSNQLQGASLSWPSRSQTLDSSVSCSSPDRVTACSARDRLGHSLGSGHGSDLDIGLCRSSLRDDLRLGSRYCCG